VLGQALIAAPLSSGRENGSKFHAIPVLMLVLGGAIGQSQDQPQVPGPSFGRSPFFAPPTMKIVIIEDHKLIRDMLAASCEQLVAQASVSVAENGRQGVALCRRLRPDLAFLDLALPDGDGLDLLDELLATSPELKVIALSSFADEFTVHRALRSPVHGFVDKGEQPLGMLKQAIDAVMAGEKYFSPAVQKLKAALRSDPVSFDKLLSDREQSLLRLFGEGLSNDAVAKLVGLTAGTVKLHRRNIHRKLGFHSTPELMTYALKKGFTRVRRTAE
jgi:DNA-binding NarL/FixJ family response regulator